MAGRVALVAERQHFYNAGVAAVLQTEIGFDRVLCVHDYAALIDVLTREGAVDLIAFDLDLPGASGISTVGEIRDMHPGMRIAVLSEHTDLQSIISVLAAGAHGFIPKQTTNCADLLRALQIVDQMGVFVPGNLDGSPPASIDDCERAEERNCTLAHLTERQQQVVQLLSEGHANKVIARELGISPSTVKVHVHAAFRALGVHSRLAALAALRTSSRPPTDLVGYGGLHVISSSALRGRALGR